MDSLSQCAVDKELPNRTVQFPHVALCCASSFEESFSTTA